MARKNKWTRQRHHSYCLLQIASLKWKVRNRLNVLMEIEYFEHLDVKENFLD